MVRETVEQADLPLRERRARRGHDILDAALVHGNHVSVALHEKAVPLAHNCAFGLVKTVKLVALAVDFTFGGVDVLRQLLFAAEDAAAEGHHLARDRMDREDHAPMVAIL